MIGQFGGQNQVLIVLIRATGERVVLGNSGRKVQGSRSGFMTY